MERIWQEESGTTLIAKAFIAQKAYKIGDRKSLVNRLHRDVTLRRLCGWETESEIPSEATFCRAFKEFSVGELPQKIHEVMIGNHAKEKLFGHVSRDSTPIEVREKPKKKAKTAEDSKPKKREDLKREKKERRLHVVWNFRHSVR